MVGGSIHQLFEDHVRRAPERTALIAGPTRLTYGELDAAAGRLAARLSVTEGLPPSGATLAVATDRVPDVVVAMLAVLKAGHAYTVIAPDTPRREIRRRLEAVRAGAVLTHRALSAGVDEGGRPAVLLDEEDVPEDRRVSADGAGRADGVSGALTSGAGGGVSVGDGAQGAATVLFTAGTTGEARPGACGHGLLRAAHAAWAGVLGLTPEDRLLTLARPETTEFTGAWIRALCSGATLVLGEGAREVAAAGWTDGGSAAGGQPDVAGSHAAGSHTAGHLALAERVTVAEVGPAGAVRLVEGELPELRLLLVGGEPLSLGGQLRLQGLLPVPDARVLVMYGTAEVAGCGTWFEPGQLAGPVARPERAAYLGVPFPGCAAEVRKGEIWLTPPGGGDAVPTGDVGRRETDGPLEFRGRLDQRVTIAGRTVDTYRIEAALAGHPEVEAAVVTGEQGRTGQRIVAFVVPAEGATPTVASLRAGLSGLVPAGDLPDLVVRLRALPRNAAGKVDRGALPLPPSAGAHRAVGKGGSGGESVPGHLVVGALVGVVAFFLSFALTDVFWPGATDRTGIPGPWSGLFGLLYVVEGVAFGVGAGFLLAGRRGMVRRGGPGTLTTLAHLAVVWLLVAWWPQDNFYRLAAKRDWERQAALVYSFNVPLMLAAAIVALWAVRRSAGAPKT
ncbi:AMP-binding protein [Streptomyces sp. SID3212]|uniref:AMP-binding protein n=1 Tax=Streptomyces sp. SID3212 TaxID=2690259 RepID=UPI001370F7CD|nr:AMP-binding protein [Streptomyces sp. SID3212]MYV53705.1 AMP-binding protein [Streptomyces sp. SID3212]